MQGLAQAQVALNSEEVDLLLWNVPNELINDFRVKEFEKVIGASETQTKSMFRELREVSQRGNVVLDYSRALIVRSALGAVIEELGIEEFQTRTGHDFEKGLTTLRKLDSFLSDAAEAVRS